MGTEARPRIEDVVETILYVDELARAAAFYEDVLGLAPMAGDGVRFKVFEAGPRRALLLFKRGATLEPTPVLGGMIPPHDGHGPLHVGFAIAAADYEPWRRRLEGCGVKIESEAQWERGGRSLYFRDPDGNLAELITPGIWRNY
ncbi:MAG TPA: VOC family protein [Opitutus sp.]|nr:VOC family protein [Opitutus sp.]